MLLDSIIVGAVVAGAVAYLAWAFFPRRRRAQLPCAACTHAEAPKAAVPVKTRWTG